MSLHVIHPGTFSLLVDVGRPRTRHLGVPLGGAADRAAFMIGNALAGNPPTAIALEMTLSGPTLRADHNISACIFGASFQCSIDGEPVPAARLFHLRPAQVLRIGATERSARGYLCVHGGFRADPVLGSGGAMAPIAVGDCLSCSESAGAGRSLAHADADSILGDMRGPGPIRFTDGPQADWFDLARFAAEPYTVLPASNRMGIRLAGGPLSRPAREMTSEVVAPGAVQITNEGLPIILGVDGQTIGGYPKIAHIIRADLDRLAQLRPGDVIRFARIPIDDAERWAIARRQEIRRLLTALRLAAL